MATSEIKLNGIFTRRAKVNRNRNPHQMIGATGFYQLGPSKIASLIPRGEGDEEIEVHFFKVGRQITHVELLTEYDERGLAPVDPYALAAVNEADPAFVDAHPNSTYWYAHEMWWFIIFFRGPTKRCVSFERVSDGQIQDDWYFAGVPK